MTQSSALLSALGLIALIGLSGCSESVDPTPATQTPGPMALDNRRFTPLPATQEIPADVLRVRQVQIMDPGFFGREMVALTLMVPADWQDQGAVSWADTLCQMRMQQIQWEARSPDGRERMQIMPAEGWTHTRSNMGGSSADPSGCPDWTFSSLREYLEAWIVHHRPGARVLDFELDPAASQALAAAVPQVPAMDGLQYNNRAEAGHVLLAYQESGVEFREVLSTGLVLIHTRMHMPDYGTGYSFQSETLSGSTLPMMTARAPAGELDLDRFEALGSTVHMNPEYGAEVSRFFANLSRTRMEGERERHQIRMDTINHVGQLNRDSYNNRMDSLDRSSQQFSQTMREVQSWIDPVSRQQVELPMHYRNAWRMADGTYLMTNNDGFDPWRDMRLNADRMQLDSR